MAQEVFSENREEVPQGQGMLIVLTGPTAAGKDTLGNQLLLDTPGLQKITSYTTRPKREGEADGTNYHFIDMTTFQELAAQDAFVMVSQYGDSHYGTPKNELLQTLEGNKKLWVVSIETAGRMKDIIDEAYEPEVAQRIKDRLLILFVGVERLTVLKDRYQSRNGDIQGLKKRLENDWSAWKKYESCFEHIVMNAQRPEDILVQAQTLINTMNESLNSSANTLQGTHT